MGFDPDKLERLADRAGLGEYTLDLRGVTAEHAETAIERMLERRRFGEPTSVTIEIDSASPTSGETLFQPVGRQLLEARRKGMVSMPSPLTNPPDGGYYIELPGHPNHAKDAES